ncbi:MAG TPA: CbiQ family ECF transporter T component [Rhodocyclaceae bacterium]|nr:CbiQ family ECF transporter T component [Rhodocyclaceae bacterium]
MVGLQQLGLGATLLATALALFFGWVANRRLLNRLLFRSRWLFLTMLILFLWSTPGVRLPAPWGGVGMTREGLEFAVEHVSRLAAMLALLAILLSRLDHRAIVSGLYVLLRPLSGFADLRRSVAVRLTLTLEEAAEKNGHEWKSLLKMPRLDDTAGEPALQLVMPRWTWRDSALLLGALGISLWLLERP